MCGWEAHPRSGARSGLAPASPRDGGLRSKPVMEQALPQQPLHVPVNPGAPRGARAGASSPGEHSRGDSSSSSPPGWSLAKKRRPRGSHRQSRWGQKAQQTRHRDTLPVPTCNSARGSRPSPDSGARKHMGVWTPNC